MNTGRGAVREGACLLVSSMRIMISCPLLTMGLERLCDSLCLQGDSHSRDWSAFAIPYVCRGTPTHGIWRCFLADEGLMLVLQGGASTSFISWWAVLTVRGTARV